MNTLRTRQAVMDLVDAYARSKVLRLGAVWTDSSNAQRQQLNRETGVRLYKLKDYANRLREHFPHTRDTEYNAKRWSPREDAAIREVYARREWYRDRLKKQLLSHEGLRGRSWEAIAKRATALGLTKKQVRTK